MGIQETDLKNQARLRRLQAVAFTNVALTDSFWAPRLKTHREVILPACLDRCEQTGRIANFGKAAGLTPGKFEGIFFNDSDLYKVLEGVAYSLIQHPDPALEDRADRIIELIAAAQEADGYVNTYHTLEAPDLKWSDMDKHEDYCAGHLIEAAIAYKQATGKTRFLEVACQLADYLDAIFGPGKRHWVTGHQEVELALVKLYHETAEERYLKLAQWFLDERGHGHGRGKIWDRAEWGPRYCQDDLPVREMTDIGGHAVRAMYLYTGMADVAAETGDRGYINALDRLWESVTRRNMYLTGGIGSSKDNEGFTRDYDLPNDTAYCETCASVGLVFWSHRMNLLHGDGHYLDILERVLYNGVLAGVSLDGDTFFYVNSLSSDGSHHRRKWYDVSCCPTQIARFLPSIGNYIYAVSEDEIWVNLYVSSRSRIPWGSGSVEVIQRTEYPWDGQIELMIQPDGLQNCGINLRIPGWCKSFMADINGAAMKELLLENGYLKMNRSWQPGDRITLKLDMPVEKVHAHPCVAADAGKVALQRGPLVYCFEAVDNPDFNDLQIEPDALTVLETRSGLLNGVRLIYVASSRKTWTAVPYYAWDNREPGRMAVWVPELKKQFPDLYCAGR